MLTTRPPIPRPVPIWPFVAAALAPVPLLGLGTVFGGAWLLAGLVYVTLLAVILDHAIAGRTDAATEAESAGRANGLSIVLALSHFGLLPLAVIAVSGASGLGGAERAAAFLGFGLYFGQVSVANAHELIHRTDRRLFGLGKWVFISLLYGHVTSSHRLLHHPHVATPRDPNFPPLGISFYRYLPRSMMRNFIEGYRIEQARAARSGRASPYIAYIAGGLAFLIAAALGLGGPGLAAYLGLCLYAQMQHAMVDYLQHYGLSRRRLPDGSHEPQAAYHSWNSPHWFTSLMTVNVTRHSDHHAHPGRVYPALRLTPDMPMLPYSLPVMGAIALIPPIWFKIMDKRVARVMGRAHGM